MAILNFPDNPVNGQLYPVPCPAGTTQYRWDQATDIWRIVGVATGVTPGTYGDEVTVPRISIDVQGIITDAEDVPIRSSAVGVQGIVALNDTTSSVSITQALTARAGKYLQDQIGNLSACIVPQHLNVVNALNYLQGQINRIDIEALAWCGYYNAQDGYVSYVSTVGQALGYNIGDTLPTPDQLNAGNFFIVNVAGNPYIGGDYNAPNAFIPVGNWVLQDRFRWVDVETGARVTARDVIFDNRNSCFTATTVQGALQQVCAYFRQPIGGATIAEQKPDNPYQGQLWWDSNDGYFYIYYRDGAGAQWVEIGGGGSEGLGGGGGTVYEIRTGLGLTGGPITTEGTIDLVPAGIGTAQLGGVFIQPNKGLKLLKTGEVYLQPATKDLIGGIIVGAGLSITPEGVLSSSGGQGTSADDVSVRPISGISTADTAQEALEAIQLEVQDRVETVSVQGEGIQATVTPAVFTSNQGTELRITPVRASTTAVGVVSLTNNLDGNSETLALTQKAGNYLQSEISALLGVNVLAGTYDASIGKMVYVTPSGALKGFVAGQNCPPASTEIDNYYVIVITGGNFGPPGGQVPAGAYDWYICQADAGTTPVWFLIDYPSYTVDANQVTLGPVPGLTATNVYDGIVQVQSNASSRTKNITSAAGLAVQYNATRDCQIDIIAATKDNLGGVYVVPGRGLLLGNDGGLSLLPPTTDGIQIGGVKAGENITIAADGTISASGGGGGGGAATDVTVNPIPGIEFAKNAQTALEALELQVQDRVEFIKATTVGINIKVSDPGPTSNDGTTAELGLDFANLGQRGIVQLTNDITGSSEEIAPTQKAVSVLNSKVDALTGANVLAGTYNCTLGTVATVTPAGRAAGFIEGKQAPLAKNTPDNYYLIITTGGGYGPPGAIIPPGGLQPADWFVCERETGVDAAWVTIDFVNTNIAAQNVALSAIPGFAATNVQSGFQEVVTDLAQCTTQVVSTNDGIVVNLGPVQFQGAATFGQKLSVTLRPATATDIGGVYTAPGSGLNLTPSGALSVDKASASTIGGIKVGAGLSISADGTLSADAGPAGITIKLLDDIGPQFNGTNVSFVLQILNQQLPTTVTEAALFIEIGGITQPPLKAYSFNPVNSTITFTSAPPSGTEFSGRVILGG